MVLNILPLVCLLVSEGSHLSAFPGEHLYERILNGLRVITPRVRIPTTGTYWREEQHLTQLCLRLHI